MNTIHSQTKFNTKKHAQKKNKKPAMILSVTSMAALLAACGEDSVTSINISGLAKQGETLSASLTDAGATNITYQWQSSGTTVLGSTNSTYVSSQKDLGKNISVTTSYMDEQGLPQNLTSTATTPITIGASFALAPLNSIFLVVVSVNNGFRIDGASGNDLSGNSVSSAGDVNGDGYDDIIIGSPYAASNGNSTSGSSYIIYGSESGTSIDLSTLHLNRGIRIDGATAGDFSGSSVSSAGDVNGDGYDDFIIGAWGADPNGNSSGTSYVVYGGTGLTNIDLDTLTLAQGFRIEGVDPQDQTGATVSAAGDVNGDGFDDVIIGAHGADPFGFSSSGSSFVIYGSAVGSNISLAALVASQGFRINGVDSLDYSGVSVSAAGDVNGDGYADVIIGAYGADPNGSSSGSSYIVYGGTGLANLNLSALQPTQGFRVSGAGFEDNSGRQVSSAGDVNGDGYDDLIIGASNVDSNGLNSGTSYVIFGGATGQNINLDSFSPTDGFTINGVAAHDSSGSAVSSAGDFNGDGYDDLIIGASSADPDGNLSAGSSYVVFGNENLTNINLSDLDGSNGFRLDGTDANDYSGHSVSSAGDVNADGYDDIIIGANGLDSNGNIDNGASYIVYGGAHFAETATTASPDDDVSIGDDSANTLSTGVGKDVLKGGLGADILTGGADADHIWGGGNSDTYSFAPGDSQLTITGVGNLGEVSGYDVIHDFKVATTNFLSETIDLADGFSIAETAVTNGTNSALQIYTDGTIKSHSITDGVIGFDNSDIYVSALNLSTQGGFAAAVQYLQLQDLGNAGTTVAFDYGADTFIFSQGDDLGTDDLDILIKLEATQVDSLITSNAIGDFDLLIA